MASTGGSGLMLGKLTLMRRAAKLPRPVRRRTGTDRIRGIMPSPSGGCAAASQIGQRGFAHHARHLVAPFAGYLV